MSVRAALVSLLGTALLGGSLAGKNTHLPTSFPRCSLSKPGLDDCLRDAVQAAIPELVKGVPSLGVFPIDPLEIVEADIGATEGPVALSLNFKKLKLKGVHAAKILSASFDPKTNHIKLRAKLTAPLKIDSDYKIAGKVLVLPIQGEGPCSLVLDNVVAEFDISAKEVKKHGQKYLSVNKLAFSFTTSRLHMTFNNLFNGNKELGANMNRFLNENWPDILRELQSSIEATFGAAFEAIASRIFSEVSYNNIFLP